MIYKLYRKRDRERERNIWAVNEIQMKNSVFLCLWVIQCKHIQNVLGVVLGIRLQLGEQSSSTCHVVDRLDGHHRHLDSSLVLKHEKRRKKEHNYIETTTEHTLSSLSLLLRCKSPFWRGTWSWTRGRRTCRRFRRISCRSFCCCC